MASRDHRDGYLDSTAGRELVFCHVCSNEWYGDGHGLICPRCESDITEIISPENDPRYVCRSPESIDAEAPPLRYAHDAEENEDEDDIEEHIGPHGFFFNRSTGSSSERSRDPTMDPVLERFIGMVRGFGPARQYGGEGPFDRLGNESYQPPRIQYTTFISGPFRGGSASVTIFSRPALTRRGDGGTEFPDHMAAFQTMFSNLIQGVTQPESEGEAGSPVGFARRLEEILNHFNPGDSMIGDVTYSQEALDRIITQIMEANPQSNAAPPASEEALNRLERRTVDREILENGGETACTICIEEMEVDEKVMFLPCKHWFHEDCVVLWLKAHDTCPVCRTPIEKNEENEGKGNTRGSTSGGVGPLS